MNGVYRIPYPAELEPSTVLSHPPVAKLIKALDPGAEYSLEIRDKLDIEVREHRDCHSDHWTIRSASFPKYVEIRALGGTPRKRKPAYPIRLVTSVPPAPTRAQVEKRLASAREHCRSILGEFKRRLEYQMRAEIPYHWRNQRQYNPERRARHRQAGKLLRRVFKLANDKRVDYAEISIQLGVDVKRWSALRKHEKSRGYFGYLVGLMADAHYKDKQERKRLDTPASPAPQEPERPIHERLTDARAEVEYLRELLRLTGGTE